jgi:hypothetical protein
MNCHKTIHAGLLLIIVMALQGCTFEHLYKMQQRHKVFALEQVDMQKLIQLYMNKAEASVGTLEGIYSVSGLVTRSGKNLMGGEDNNKVTDRRENYAKVAIIRDPNSASREYIELLLDDKLQFSLSIIGEFSGMADGNVLVYKHFENKGKNFETYTFAFDGDKDVLEGVRTENKGNATITYKLTYLKILPKGR